MCVRVCKHLKFIRRVIQVYSKHQDLLFLPYYVFSLVIAAREYLAKTAS